MAPPPVLLARGRCFLQGVVPASIDVVGAPGRADTQGPPKEHALTFVTPAPITLSHVITTLRPE